MYDLLYVRKRRRRRIAAIGSLICGIVITSFIITSFVGRYAGTFSVSIANTSVNLSLSERKDGFENGKSTYLRLDNELPFNEYHYKDLPNPSVLDDENVKYNDIAALGLDEKMKPESIYYFKYTFYVKNTGNTTAYYNLTVSLSENSKSSDESGRMLDDTLRVMFFENDGNTDSHEFKYYAKEAAGNNYKENGDLTRQEFVGYNCIGGYEDAEHPLAETFDNPNTVCEYKVNNFRKDDIKRYTIVFWLEGADPQSRDSELPPKDAKLKLGVDIRAYEEK